MWKKGRVDSIPTDVSINQGSGIEIESERVERKKRGKVGNGVLFLFSAPASLPLNRTPDLMSVHPFSFGGASTDK